MLLKVLSNRHDDNEIYKAHARVFVKFCLRGLFFVGKHRNGPYVTVEFSCGRPIWDFGKITAKSNIHIITQTLVHGDGPTSN